MEIPTPKSRGLRYWGIFSLMLFTWSFLFLNSVSILRSSINLFNFLVVAALFYAGTALLTAYRDTRPARFPIFHEDPDILGIRIKEVSFKSRDGVELSGWYITPRNGAVIILTHGFGGNRLLMLRYARLFSQHGYGVLMYDLRSHGRSQASLNTWGWLEIYDLLGAVDFVRSRPDGGRHIGAFGLSLGGQISLRAAEQNEKIQAVAADGPSVAALRDHLLTPGLTLRKVIFYPWYWMLYNFETLLTGVRQPAGVAEIIGRLAPRPVMLIAAGRGGERQVVHHFFDLASEPKELLEVPEARHGEAINARPDEYKSKLLAFFDRALLVD
jgi:pimeloyl-ACP methyl ester carboxylesterase